MTNADNLLQVMTLMMAADGKIKDSEFRAIADIYGRLTGQPLTSEDMEARMLEVSQVGAGQILEQLRSLAPSLDQAAKEQIIEAAYAVSAADHVLQDEEREIILQVGDSLGMEKRTVLDLIGAMLTGLRRHGG